MIYLFYVLLFSKEEKKYIRREAQSNANCCVTRLLWRRDAPLRLTGFTSCLPLIGSLLASVHNVSKVQSLCKLLACRELVSGTMDEAGGEEACPWMRSRAVGRGGSVLHGRTVLIHIL